MVADFAFPLIFIGILGTSLQAGFGGNSNINLLDYVFTGVLAQTIWQSTALGVISLLMDREQDFSQEIFVSPISRYSIIFGKILGESLVALPQAVAIVALGVVLGVPFTPQSLAPLPLDILSKISPMRYAVDLMRDVYYGSGSGIPAFDLPTNLAIIAAEFALFMVIGTAGFVRAERNR